MDFHVPTDLIQQVQISLRKEAGLSSYDPHDPTLPALPSLSASIAGFDPSPTYLRCKHCKGRLLRGIQSVICVYCGQRLLKDVPLDPITFKSTFGYQWLLQSLGLDGSEILGPSNIENKSNRGQSTPKEGTCLSDLLNLEIAWPMETEKPEYELRNNELVQSSSYLNLTGVNLDNFFTETKRENVSFALEERTEINKQSDNAGMSAFSVQENISLFQNVQHSKLAVSSYEVNDGFSGWEADFQSVDSGNQHEGSRSYDPFVGSTVDLSAHMDSVFGPGKHAEGEKPRGASTSLTSTSNDLIQDNLWKNSNVLAPHVAEQPDETITTMDVLKADNPHNHSSTKIDWFPDDQWKTSSITALDNKTILEDEDSFEVWNDFTSFTSVQDPSKNHLTQSGNQSGTVDEHTSETSDTILTNLTNKIQAMDSGSFSQMGLFSGSSSNQSNFVEVKNAHSEIPTLDRMADVKIGGRDAGQAANGGDIFNSNMQSKADNDRESLLSQMHDLSFMLEDDLSVPSK